MKRHIKFEIKILFTLIISGLFLNACKENIVESTASIDDIVVFAKFSDIQNKVFNKSCALSGCHVEGNQNPNLSGNAFNRIVNQSSSQGLKYIEPGNPERSYLYMKITGASGISGVRMPRGSAPLAQSVIDSIRVWITNGAMNN